MTDFDDNFSNQDFEKGSKNFEPLNDEQIAYAKEMLE